MRSTRSSRSRSWLTVVADRLEVLLPYVSGLDGAQGGPPPGDAEGPVDAQGGVQGDALGQVRKVPAHGDGSLQGAQMSGEQTQQGRLAGAVGADQTGAAAGDGEGESVEEAGAVGPPEGEVGGGHGGAGRGGMADGGFSQSEAGGTGGLRMRTARGDPAVGPQNGGENSPAKVRDGSAPRSHPRGSHGRQTCRQRRDRVRARAVPRDDRGPQMRNVHLYRRQQDVISVAVRRAVI